ncbi:hypothetical protein QR680_007968 [Steinernema hermaphroditum]|uniref:Uncharacterized protein n=1 Tax=Steinernema hermaphroditum TaxID=289476 RepID=A0AA39M788_9BILA|nr:hypothetical protein QR680_007968 [Steinernema hermaphroditum]
MSVDLKQHLNFQDYTAPFLVFISFFGIIFLISFTVLNYCFVSKKDDITVFEEWGYRHKVSLKMGPHEQQQLQELVPQKRSVVSLTN